MSDRKHNGDAQIETLERVMCPYILCELSHDIFGRPFLQEWIIWRWRLCVKARLFSSSVTIAYFLAVRNLAIDIEVLKCELKNGETRTRMSSMNQPGRVSRVNFLQNLAGEQQELLETDITGRHHKLTDRRNCGVTMQQHMHWCVHEQKARLQKQRPSWRHIFYIRYSCAKSTFLKFAYLATMLG